MKKAVSVWGIHMEKGIGPRAIEKSFIAIGWKELGDLKQYTDLEAFNEALQNNYPNKNRRSYGQHSGVLNRFVYKMKRGDIVVYPSKHDRKVNIGRIEGDVRHYKRKTERLPNRRKVKWLESFDRSDFSYSMLSEIRAYITLFQIRRHAEELLKRVKLETVNFVPADEDDTEESYESTIIEFAKQAELSAEDFILERIFSNIDPYEFEELVANLLEGMGYTARVTSRANDGGVDVIAHYDRLGCTPPILKVQCKQKRDKTPPKDIQRLLGTLGDGEYGLFISLGGFSNNSIRIERENPKIRLIDHKEFVELIFDYYDHLSPLYRNLFPLKKIYVPDIQE